MSTKISEAMIKTKLSLLFISSVLVLASCSSAKLASSEVVDDPIYASGADIKKAIRMEKVAQDRAALEKGSAQNQGKKSGSVTGKYDYMPASSYGERFNRTGNSFFLNDRSNNSFYGNRYNSQFNSGMMGMGGFRMGGMFNPSFGMGVNCNPWNQRYMDPFLSYQMMGANSYPFFTYNPYMYSYSLLNNMYNPYMMGGNPYFYNPYYAYSPYGYGNNYCPYGNTYRTASSPNRNYISQRRNSNIGTNSNSTQSNRNSSYNNNSNSNNSGNSSSTNTNTNRNTGTTFGNSGSGTSRGGYNSSSRSSRGTSGSKGSKRR